MGLVSIRREQEMRNIARFDNGIDPSQALRQTLKDCVKEAVREELDMIPGVRALRWMKDLVNKLIRKLKLRGDLWV